MERKITSLIVVALFGGAGFALREAGYLPDADQALAFLADSRETIFMGAYMMGVATVAMIWVTVGLSRNLENVASGTVAVGGSVLAAAGLNAGFFLAVPQAERAAAGTLDASTASLAYDFLVVGVGNVSAFGFALMVGGLALAGLSTGRLPTWVVWAGLGVAIGLLTPLQWSVAALAPLWLVACAWTVDATRTTAGVAS